MQYQVSDLQACEPMELLREYPGGIALFFAPEKDSMGFDRVTVSSDSREALLGFIRDNWGDDDAEWWQEWVVARIEVFPDGKPKAVR